MERSVGDHGEDAGNDEAVEVAEAVTRFKEAISPAWICTQGRTVAVVIIKIADHRRLKQNLVLISETAEAARMEISASGVTIQK